MTSAHLPSRCAISAFLYELAVLWEKLWCRPFRSQPLTSYHNTHDRVMSKELPICFTLTYKFMWLDLSVSFNYFLYIFNMYFFLNLNIFWLCYFCFRLFQIRALYETFNKTCSNYLFTTFEWLIITNDT